jgi:acetyl esterase
VGRIFFPGPFSYPGPKHAKYVFDGFDGEEAKVLVYPPAPRSDGRKSPILVYVHGGGWIVGDADQRGHDWQWFARQGYLLIAVNYTLSADTRHLWNVTQPQIGCALAWIEKNGARLGGDPARIALMGESAGGNLVLGTSGRAYRGELPSRCGGNVPKPKATIAISPPTDLVALYAHKPAQKFAVAYTGGSPRQYPDRYAMVSPILQAGAPAPPLLLMTGEDDGVVPLRDMLRYVALARRAGQSVEVITVPRAGHGFEIMPGSIGHQTMMKASDAFLRRHGMAPDRRSMRAGSNAFAGRLAP